MKELTIVITFTKQANPAESFEKLKALLKAGFRIVIVDINSKKIPELNELTDTSYFHCANEPNRIVTHNAILADNSKTDNDVLLIDGSLLPYLPIDNTFFQELKYVLYYTEKHGFTSPRLDKSDNLDCYSEKLKILPRFSTLIEPDTRFIYIKKRVLDLLEFFDDSYNSFHFALLDFVQRANQFGFCYVRSNHVIIANVEKQGNIDSSNVDDKKLLLEKYPYYTSIKENHAIQNEQSIEKFVTLFSKSERKKRILFNYRNLICAYNGTVIYQLAVINSFYNLFKDKYDIYIYVTRDADNFHKLSNKYSNVIYDDTISGVFDLGFSGNQLYQLTDHMIMNKHCLKSVYVLFDAISLRCNYINDTLPNVSDVTKLGFHLSDGIIAISDYTVHDYRAYIDGDLVIQNKPIKRVYCASDFSINLEKKHELPFDDYFLIVGNNYKHKALLEAIEAISNTNNHFIVMGHGDNDYISNNIYGYASGQLDDDFANYLYSNCTALIFPSIYEGFGLPVALALKMNKHVVLYNSAVNNELLQHYTEHKNLFHFFDKFSQINDILNTADFSIASELKESNYTWDDAAREIEAFFNEILSEEVNAEKLKERAYLFNLLESNPIRRLDPEPLASQDSESQALSEPPLVTVKRKLYNRFPKLYMFLKSTIRK